MLKCLNTSFLRHLRRIDAIHFAETLHKIADRGKACESGNGLDGQRLVIAQKFLCTFQPDRAHEFKRLLSGSRSKHTIKSGATHT